jgi:arsenate reductase-like glutaredoxin family protein
LLREKGVAFEEVDLNKGLSVAELDALIGKRDYKDFLNTRNELYRERGMKENPPSRDEALKLMSETPNLIKRPILVEGDRISWSVT